MISHWHDELEFIYILGGKMDFHIEEKILTASAEISLPSTLPPCTEARRTMERLPLHTGAYPPFPPDRKSVRQKQASVSSSGKYVPPLFPCSLRLS